MVIFKIIVILFCVCELELLWAFEPFLLLRRDEVYLKWEKATGEVHMDILKKIELYRKEEEKLKWEGTFGEYLEIVKEKPWVAQSAHSRVYNMIKDAGVEEGERE